MTALRLQAPPSMRLPASLAMAMVLHVLALLALPALWQVGGALADRIAGREAPPKAEAHGEVIPIKLPTVNQFELVTELGAIARSTSGQKADTLPSAQTARGTAMSLSLSQSLAAAAHEAQAAYERLHPQPEKLRFVAELRLADGPTPALASPAKKPAAVVAAQTPEPATKPTTPPATQEPADDAGRKAKAAQQREQARQDARQAQEARDMLAQAQRMADEQARRDRAREQAEERERNQRALQQAIDQAARQPLTRSPGATAGNAAQRARQHSEDPHPKIFNPADPYRGALPNVIADAPTLPAQANAQMTAGGPVLGEGAAPERGPGEAVENRTAFFQRLTNHLFQINQIMLAEAIRATPRMTVEVHFTVDRNGRVIEAAVSRSTGDPWLDEKAVSVIQRASPMPRLSSDMPQQKLELSFPVQIYR